MAEPYWPFVLVLLCNKIECPTLCRTDFSSVLLCLWPIILRKCLWKKNNSPHFFKPAVCGVTKGSETSTPFSTMFSKGVNEPQRWDQFDPQQFSLDPLTVWTKTSGSWNPFFVMSQRALRPLWWWKHHQPDYCSTWPVFLTAALFSSPLTTKKG